MGSVVKGLARFALAAQEGVGHMHERTGIAVRRNMGLARKTETC